MARSGKKTSSLGFGPGALLWILDFRIELGKRPNRQREYQKGHERFGGGHAVKTKVRPTRPKAKSATLLAATFGWHRMASRLTATFPRTLVTLTATSLRTARPDSGQIRPLGVMAGLSRPSTSSLQSRRKRDVDARDKRAHPECGSTRSKRGLIDCLPSA
jgi:hypothetical protein